MSSSILIVDDEYGLADMLGALLGMRGYHVRIAINGEAGLELALAQPFTLILTDVMMPHMDGIEMIRNIRATPERANTPIIVMTAMPSGITPEERALAQGVLTKPFGHQELFAMVADVLRTRSEAAPCVGK